MCVCKQDLVQLICHKTQTNNQKQYSLVGAFFPCNCAGGAMYRSSQLEIYIVFVAASHQTGLHTRSKARRPIKVGIKARGRSGTSRAPMLI